MKPAIAQPRSSELVQSEIDALEKLVNSMPPPPEGDFAAEVQWRSWRSHRAGLDEELAQARLIEREIALEEAEQDFIGETALRGGLENLIAKARRFFGSAATRPDRAKESKREDSRHTKV